MELTYKLTQKNVLYIKLFQAFALNNKLIDDNINKLIMKYTDCVPYTNEDVDWLLLDDITEKYNLDFDNYYQPINSGMISLVYKLKENDSNNYYILKMKRKNIDEKLENSIKNIMFIMWILSFIPYFNTLQIPVLFNENIDSLKELLNFHIEVKNTMDMKEACKNLTYIVIPTINKEVTDNHPNAILMEYIKGSHITKIDENDYETYAKLVLKYGFVNSFFHGTIHGDLHAGNILFIKNDESDELKDKYQIGIIDFGIVMHFDDDFRTKLMNIFLDLFDNDPMDISVQLLNILLDPPYILNFINNEDKKNIISITEKIIKNAIYKSKQLNQIMFYDFLMDLNNYLNSSEVKKSGLSVNDEFIKIQMAITMAHGVSMHLCKDNYMEIAHTVLNDLFHTNVFLEIE
jgi:predicted unusual protein kinase regulating ubiquinone biosynthesis (AarF/ABC1/UbiB family)